MRTVIIGPTGSHLRTVNVATGASGMTGTWETVRYAASGPTGLFETVKVASTRDNLFSSLAIPGFTGTVTADAGGGGDLPAPPEGFFYVIQDSQYVIDDNGAYVINGV